MTGEYAIRAMVGLATAPFGTVMQISEIADQWDISENFLRKITAHLAKAGLICSQRGTKGGIRLAIPAEKLTLLDVIEAAEGKMFLNKCLMGPECCTRTSWCAMRDVWREAQDAMKSILSKKSLAEIASLNTSARAHCESVRQRVTTTHTTMPKAS